MQFRRFTTGLIGLAMLLAVAQGAMPAKAINLGVRTMVQNALKTTTTTAPDTSPGVTGFTTKGAKVYDAAGNEFTMRGVNKAGFEYSAYGYDNDLWNYQRIKSWGANTIRFPVASNFALPSMCSYDKDYMGRIDRAADFAKQLQMLLVIDDHFGTKGATCGTGNAWSTNQKMPDGQNLALLKLLGQRYKNNPYVAIDLYNEPHDVSWDIWRNGGKVDNYQSVGMQALLDGVRATGFKGLVLASGNSWATDLSEIARNPLSNDSNVVYSGHAYPFSCGPYPVDNNTPYFCQGLQRPPYMESQQKPLISKRPVVIGEFGTPRAIDGEMRAMVKWAEDNKVGWLAWQWTSGTPDNFALLQDDGQTPSVVGQVVQQYLLKSKGWTAPHPTA